VGGWQQCAAGATINFSVLSMADFSLKKCVRFHGQCWSSGFHAGRISQILRGMATAWMLTACDVLRFYASEFWRSVLSLLDMTYPVRVHAAIVFPSFRARLAQLLLCDDRGGRFFFNIAIFFSIFRNNIIFYEFSNLLHCPIRRTRQDLIALAGIETYAADRSLHANRTCRVGWPRVERCGVRRPRVDLWRPQAAMASFYLIAEIKSAALTPYASRS
jgi:hypothetical protein